MQKSNEEKIKIKLNTYPFFFDIFIYDCKPSADMLLALSPQGKNLLDGRAVLDLQGPLIARAKSRYGRQVVGLLALRCCFRGGIRESI